MSATGAGAPPGSPDASGMEERLRRAPPRHGGRALLEARDLEVTPPGGGRPAVSGITLAVGPGEWIAVTGRNGGGKSSLLMGLAGLWPVSAGTLSLDGVPFGPGCRAIGDPRLSVVLQDPSSQLLQATVGEELAFTARNLGLPEAEIARSVSRWSEALGLEAELGLEPAGLSAGRQQLVLLAAALVARPRLLVADEPTAHLDAAARSRVRAAVAAQVEAGLGVVWATQDPAEVETAGRALTVGEEAPLPPGPSPQGRRRPTELALRLRVEPDTEARGPRVRVNRALVIDVPRAGVTALVGSNGAGKSVILSAAAGLLHLPQVRIDWQTPPAFPPVMALQYPELQVFEEEVADEVVFAAVARGVPRAKALAAAEAALASLGLVPGTLLGRRTWTLSTGEKRLIEVVGALIAPAGLVLLDEPTAGLDPLHRAGLAWLVTERSAAAPVLLASQDSAWVEALGDGVCRVGE